MDLLQQLPIKSLEPGHARMRLSSSMFAEISFLCWLLPLLARLFGLNSHCLSNTTLFVVWDLNIMQLNYGTSYKSYDLFFL